MTSKLWVSILALMLVVGVVFVPAIAQKAKDGAVSKDDQMSRMMTMMEQMQEQMKRMHDDMAGMMGQMNGMMHQHHADMQKGCPGMRPPDQPKQGG